jgi:predicted Zn-dependent protease with MMP-like domain
VNGQASDAERILDEADDAFGAEEYERAVELARKAGKRARKDGEPALQADCAALEAAALNQLGESAAALARADEALRLDASCTGAHFERGFALYELVRFADARKAIDEGLREAEDEAWGQHLLGLVAERLGETGVSKRAFARARRLAPEEYPEPVRLTEGAFDAAVEDALAKLPPAVRDYLANVPITVEPLPSEEELRASDPPLSPSILGLFRGAPYGAKGAGDPWSHFPSSIVLYQRNLEMFARDREELVEEIDVTLLHEVGHFLGLDEEELAARGLE